MYQYDIYGIRLQSAFKLGSFPLATSDNRMDVIVKKKKIQRPPNGLENTHYKPYCVYNSNIYFLDVSYIAKFQINDKCEILIDKYKEATWKDVWPFFFDTIISALLLRHDVFVFHASAVGINKKSYLFCAPSGVGKSTLALSLYLNKGAKIIEDDRCLIKYNKKSGGYYIINNYPYLELWSPEAKAFFKKKKVQPLSKIRSNIQKFQFDLSSITPKKSVRVDKIVLINSHNIDNNITHEVLTGIRKINVTLSYTHLQHLISPFGKNQNHFKFIAHLANNVPIIQVTKSKLTKFKEFNNYIENEIFNGTA